jgi:hypothetical protein
MDGEYVLGRPHPALAGCVVRYLGYREHSSAPVRRRQAPGASCTLILSFGPPIRLYGPAGPSVPASFLAGMHDGPVLTEFTGHQHGVQADLRPLGVFALLGRPMPELTNVTPQLTDLDVPELAGLPARLAEAPDWPRRFALLDDVLLPPPRRVRRAAGPGSGVGVAAAGPQRGPGRGAGAGRRHRLEPPPPAHPLP